jgi:hypothetical protein
MPILTKLREFVGDEKVPYSVHSHPQGSASGTLVARQYHRPLGSIGRGNISGAVRRRTMIRKLASGEYRLYSRKKNPRTGRRRNLGTFPTRVAAERHERAVQFFKRH